MYSVIKWIKGEIFYNHEVIQGKNRHYTKDIIHIVEITVDSTKQHISICRHLCHTTQKFISQIKSNIQIYARVKQILIAVL